MRRNYTLPPCWGGVSPTRQSRYGDGAGWGGALAAAILVAGLACAQSACSVLKDQDVLKQPERSELPEYPGRAAQHRILTVLWRVHLMRSDSEPVDHYHYGRAALSRDGGRLYVGSHEGTFFCIDTRLGKVIWRKLAEGPFDAQPLVAGGVVYAGSGSGVLHAWRESDGELIWKYTTKAALDARPVLARDRLLVAGDTNTLTCLDAMTGEWRWNYRREVPSGRFQVKGVATPLVVDQAVYAGFSDGYLAKLSLEDGAVLAVRKLSGKGDRFTDLDTDPLLAFDDLLLVGPFSRGVVALDPAGLKERWSHEAKGVSSMVRRGHVVYYSTADSRIEALRIDTARPIWRFDAVKGALSRPVLAGNWLLVSSSEHSLLVLDRRDGKLLQIFNPGKGSGAAPTVAGNRVYWISNGQTLYCMGIVR